MTAVITAPTEMPESLVPATQVGPQRAPAGGFELLMALLQAGAAPTPEAGAPTLLIATPVMPDADSAIDDLTVAPVLLTPRPSRALVPGTGTSGEAVPDLDAKDDEDTNEGSSAFPADMAALVLTVAITPIALVPDDPSLAVGARGTSTVEGAANAGEAASARIAGATPKGPAQLDAIDGNVPADAARSQASDESSTPVDPALAAALDPRARFERSSRTVDAFRNAEAAAALASVREDLAQRLAAASSMARVATSRDAASDRFGAASRETETDAPTPSGDSAISAVPVPGLSLASRGAAAIAESARPEPARDPIDQIATRLREVRTPGHHELSVRLDPPELGAVRIDARLDGARLHLQIHAEHAPTGELLADALPRLREALSQQGFVPTDVSVHLGFEASGRQFTRDDAPTFTPPRDGEPAPTPLVVRLPAAREAVTSDGLDVWA